MLQAMAMPAAQMPRRNRTPRHPFAVKFIPYQIQPFFISPVLPGETLKNALVQAKAVSAPIKNDLLGANLEMAFFYIPARYLANGEAYTEMMVDPTYDASALTSTTDNAKTFFAASVANPGIDFVQECLEIVTEQYFRDEGEAWNTRLIDGLPAARVKWIGHLDSAIPASEYSTVDVLLDENADGDITASEAQRGMMMWQMLVSQGRTDKSYADYMRSYGVRTTAVEEKRIEEVRFLSEWTYPSRYVEPTTGVPSATWGWSIQDRIDKQRYMKEPGFLFGVTVCRPKVYFRNVKGTSVSFWKDALSWLPGEVINDLAYGLPEFAAATGPIEAASAAYMFDLRDLLHYGEQFVNFDLASTSDGIVALPSADMTNTRYVSLTDVQDMFTAVASPSDYQIRMDGMLSLTIASKLGKDLTVPQLPEANR